MNNKTRKLLRENNEFEKNLSTQNQKTLTDIVVYLRGCNISEYHQEEVRKDIMQMVADGEARDERIESVIGEDFKQFCDEIVNAFPPRSKKEKIMTAVSEAFSLSSLMLGIWLAGGILEAILKKTTFAALSLTLGDVVNGLLIVTIAIVAIKIICKSSFKPVKEPGRIKLFLVAWVVLFLIFAAIFMISHFLTVNLVSIPTVGAILLIAGLFAASRFIDNVMI
jgi:DNA-binding ferritin-like protein (Dps family)